jgi:hypothetical protein
MSSVEPNPYAPPTPLSDSLPPPMRWRLIPAAGSFLLGLASFTFGIFAVAVMTYVVATQNANETIAGMLAGCGLYLGFGSAWMAAGWFYWQRRFRDGLIANGIGLLFPAILFAVFGI